ncbi:MAG: 2-amino-4-hydroxy-6-hydroxymethyldihydropteridine diphosphokinase [Cyclobacteriaceae bacterium]
MAKVYFLLGSNMGDKESNLSKARDKIESYFGEGLRWSNIFESEAWGKTDQPNFLNQVIEVDTKEAPTVILEGILSIENEMGRKREERWGERLIDIDVLFYGSEVISKPNLVIPHPAIPERRFTLVPLAELAAELIHPVLKKSVSQLLEECADPLWVRPFN